MNPIDALTEYCGFRVTIAAGVVSTYAGSGESGWLDGVGTSARFFTPHGLCANSAGLLFIADFFNNRIRQISSTG